MGVNINKSGIIKASCTGINDNLITFGYSMNPFLGSNAGNTIIGKTQYNDFTRYTVNTQGNDGGSYGYPVGGTKNVIIKEGEIYTWSIELRCSTVLTFKRGRMGFEGGGMVGSGNNIVVQKDWTLIYNTWQQRTNGSVAFVLYPCGDLAAGEYIDARNLKLEKGSILTPYTIPPVESKYITTNQGFLEDSIGVKLGSGYITSSDIIEI